tara:strand:- start:356 stop:1009 length:654 start_codon:yes stop_codon:yes gene_type:complete
MEIKLDNQAKFDKMMKQYLQVTSKSGAEAMNWKAYMICLGALKKTKKTTKGRIEKFWDLSKNRKKARTDGSPLLPKIVSSWSGFKPSTPYTQLESRADEIKKRRLQSIGFLRAGWLPAIRLLGKYIGARPKKPPRADALAKRAKDWGGAKRAAPRTGLMSQAMAFNAVGTYSDEAATALRSIGKDGLNKGMLLEMRSTSDYLARKFQKDADKYWNSW